MDYFDDVAPRTGPNQCAKCRKELHRADRITEVKIVGGVGSNPTGAGRCLYVCETQEYAHAECANPTLTQQLIEILRFVFLKMRLVLFLLELKKLQKQ